MSDDILRQRQPSKPAHKTWVVCAILICSGLDLVYRYVRDGFIQTGWYGTRVQYSGVLAIAITAAPLVIGICGLAMTLRAWRAYWRGQRDGKRIH